MSDPRLSKGAIMTQKDVGRILGLSGSAVSAIEKRALRKLRYRLLADPAVAELLESVGIFPDKPDSQ